MRQVIAATAVLLCAAGAALAGDLPDGVGTLAPSGSVFTTDISSATDTDDYVFQGYPGMTLTASVKIPKGGTLVPAVEVLRPGGDVLSEEDGLALTLTSKSATAKVTLDATGWWKVRVLGSGGSVGTYSVSVKYTAPVLATLPALPKNLKINASISPVGDTDDFHFEGHTGQTLTATLTVPKTSTLDPAISLIRPDGSVAVTKGQGTVEKLLTLTATIDAEGPWHLRVVGESPEPTTADPHPAATTGAYSLSMKFGKPPVVGLVPDSNGQYRIALPGEGGATIGYSLKFTGAAPTFNSMIDPTGHPVVGFPTSATVKAFGLAAGLPFGDYQLTFDAPAGTAPTHVTCTRAVKPPKSAPKRIAKLSPSEPVITYVTPDSINPPQGGPGTVVLVQVTNAIDPNAPTGTVGFSLGHTPMKNVSLLPDGKTVQGTVPDDLPEGTFDVVVFSTSGQADAVAGAFTRVPPPTVTDIDPRVGPAAGGFPIVITGSNFRAGKMGITVDGALTGVTPTSVTPTTVTFNAPSWAPTTVTFGVQDRGTQLHADLPINSFEYTATAAISRLVPSLIPTLGNEVITIQGANFSSTDKVYLESDNPKGTYEEITATQTTYVNFNKHAFLAPVRTKGVYGVYVTDQFGQPTPHKIRNLTYYSFADFTASTNLGSIGADKYDGWTTAMGDYDHDANHLQDLFISRRGDPADTAASATSLTRVLRNDGNGSFTDVTASVMPATGVDDWRADRIWCVDVNQDGWPDLILTTNTVAVPTAGLSHVRFLINEQRGGTGANANDRVFRDRTIDYMAPPRTMQKYGYFGGSSEVYVSDDWRGLDMWVGDLDKGGPGPPQIVLTHDEVKDDDNPNSDVFSSGVYCGNYCSSSGAQQSFAYAYTFYWGGSRMFFWDKTARSGQGRYKFDPTFFPRKSGPVVPQGGVPGGGQIPACSPHYNSICKGVFTPFTGKRLAVGVLDGDTKPDVAVLSDQTIQKRAKVNDPLTTTSSLQVGINKSNAGFGITDMTDVVYALGGDTKGDAIAIGQPGYPDGNSYGVIAITKASAPGPGPVMRLLKFRPPTVPGGIGDFEDITAGVMPASDSTEKFQASQLRWIDIDQDGDQDLVLLAPAPPGSTSPALRILRNERSGATVGVLQRTLDPLLAAIVTPNDHFEGDALTIGDVTGDGLLDYIVTRATPSGSGAQTRIVKTDQ
jgi:hypothetical protein